MTRTTSGCRFHFFKTHTAKAAVARLTGVALSSLLVIAIGGCALGPVQGDGSRIQVNYENGDRYDGEYYEGAPMGLGTYYKKDGTTTVATSWLRGFKPGGFVTVTKPNGLVMYVRVSQMPWAEFVYDDKLPPLREALIDLQYDLSPKPFFGEVFDLVSVRVRDVTDAIIAMPGPKSLRKIGSQCGVDAEWHNFQINKVQRLVVFATCKAGVPDGMVELYAEDATAVITGTYVNGKMVGPTTLTMLKFDDYDKLESGGASLNTYTHARGLPVVTVTNGKTRIEFADLKNYEETTWSGSTRFADGKTLNLLPFGKGRCAKVTWTVNVYSPAFAKYGKAPREPIGSRDAFESCSYRNFKSFASRDDAVYTARMDSMVAEMDANSRAEDARYQRVVEERSRQARIDAEEERNSPRPAEQSIGAQILQRGAENAALLNKIDRQTNAAVADSNRVRAAQAAERDRARAEREAERRRDAEREREARADAERKSRVAVANPEPPKYLPQVATISGGNAGGTANSASNAGGRLPADGAGTARPPVAAGTGSSAEANANAQKSTTSDSKKPKPPAKVEWGPVKLEAIAICRQSTKNKKWACDGALDNQTLVDEPTLESALGRQHCSGGTLAAGGPVIDGLQWDAYRCGHSLGAGDYDVAKKHGLITARRSYICPANQLGDGRCTTAYDGQDKR